MDQNPPAQVPLPPPSPPAAANPPAAAPPNVKQQVVERIKTAKSVLVTVGTDPSVDELASALGLTFLLGKLDKHATAVFSGAIPPAMEFLDPEANFENSVDSLRDFIIALDREKADKLRYKLEDDVVKIFITPYKSVLSKDDFQFSQGDFNVDVVVALGVEKRDDLDKAITAHGRILHDATIITINVGQASSGLGAIDWTEPEASSIAEMLMSMSEAFGSGLLDEQIGTAFLTGLVAATNRFSNEKTSPKVMTMAAQLMAAGANQQLIATNLRREGMISESLRTGSDDQPHKDDGEMVVEHDESAKTKGQPETKPAGKKPKAAKTPPNQSVSGKTTPAAKPTPTDQTPAKPPKAAASEPDTPQAPEPSLSPPPLPPGPTPTTPAPAEPADSQPLPPINDLKSEQGTLSPPSQTPEPTLSYGNPARPTFSGNLNATTAAADNLAPPANEPTPAAAGTSPVALEHQAAVATDEAAIDAARQAVADAAQDQPFDPAHNPRQDNAAQPLPSPNPLPPPQPGPAPAAEPSPVEAFLQTHSSSEEPITPAPIPAPSQEPVPTVPLNPPSSPQPSSSSPPSVPSPTPTMGDLPPMPPLPSSPDGSLPPLPPLPPVPGEPPAANTFQPQVSPDFMKNQPTSQNSWTEAGEAVAAEQAAKADQRQAKLDKMTEQYDAAVEKNQEIQQNQPNPDDHSTFPLPH